MQPTAASTSAGDLFRLAFDHAPIGAVVALPDGTIVQANQAVCAILGREPDELIGASYVDLIHPEDLDVGGENLAQVLAEGLASYTIERRCLCGDGTVIPAQIDVSLVFDPSGQPAAFLAHVQDISDRRRVMQELAAANEEVQASERRFAALVERSSDIVCVVDADGFITYHSPTIERILGFPPDSSLGSPFTAIVHPADRARLAEAFEELLMRPSGTAQAEVRVATSEGGWRNVEIMATNRLADPAVAGVVANVRDITERAEAASKITWQAFHDPLTGLPNRALLNDRLGQAVARVRRTSSRAALLFLDLDRFKLVNDSLGHEAGDLLLVEVARRLTATVRTADTVARLGGDEFVVLVDGVRDEEVLALADRLANVVAQPIDLPQGTVNTSTSIGIAFASDPAGAANLLRDADTALYRAKEKGRNRFHVFTDSLRSEALRRVELDHGLRAAIDDDRLVAHYQPIADLTTGEVASVEALVRIQDEDGNLELPGGYLEVADDSGLIVAVGRVVLEQSCAAFAGWRRTLGRRAPRRVAVNVSARELASPEFLPTIWNVLGRHDLSPRDLALEFSESTVIGADRETLRTVDRLHELGVSLSVDDFGTGYSSLAYLKRFPIASVKLDRTFVAGLGTDPSDAEIVRAVVSLGDALALDVIAEGIESPAQLELLQELGCSYGQGFLLGAPAAAVDLDVGEAGAAIAKTAAGWAVAGG
ncbi:MAG: EAL domain-containing protein [Acidimicrobiales bacterium]|nr:EAL domain-containing protein [Acidimicrobiales bacterium]HRW38650.1 EAL domain-containing protein [Aquihabitans sp.]